MLRLSLACALVTVSVPVTVSAQEGAFIARLGVDTTAIEWFRHADGRIEGGLLVRSPRVVRRTYVYLLSPDGRIAQAQQASVALNAPAGSPPILHATATFAGDSAVVVMQRPAGTQTVRAAVPADAVTVVGDSWLGMETMVARSRRSGADSTRYRTWQVGATTLGWIDVVRIGPDSFRIADENETHVARVDQQGHLLSASRPVQQFTLERTTPPADFERIAQAWAEREQRSGPLVAMSPRDTVRATVGAAAITVDYSRPSKRGRTIFGGVVPWGQVWRTGANAATQLTTDRALNIGGTSLPAGSYAVTTIPSFGGWTLILARDGREMLRAPMQVGTLPSPVEVFTISVTPRGQGGLLNLEWDTTRASIGFTVK
jgi:hypothetical protein